MIVDEVAESAWNGWPNGVEYAEIGDGTVAPLALPDLAIDIADWLN